MSDLRWAGFLRELREPFKANVGDVVTLPVADFEYIRGALPDGRRYVCDLTPRAVAMRLAPQGIPAPVPISSLTVIRCPSCAHESGVTPCQVCKGRRKLVAPHGRYV